MKLLRIVSASQGAWIALSVFLSLALGAPVMQAQAIDDETRQAVARAEAMGVRILDFTELDAPPRIAPARYPVPDEPHQLFYLQRSMNPNTVVYAARFDAQGNLDPRQPVDIYWRRYNDHGERRELDRIENLFAFGVSIRRGREAGTFRLNFRAVPQFDVILRQEGPFAAALYGTHEGHTGRLVSIYLELADYRYVPRIAHARLVVVNMANSRYLDVHVAPVD